MFVPPRVNRILGHLVPDNIVAERNGVSIDPEKTSVIGKWHVSKNASKVHLDWEATTSRGVCKNTADSLLL